MKTGFAVLLSLILVGLHTQMDTIFDLLRAGTLSTSSYASGETVRSASVIVKEFKWVKPYRPSTLHIRTQPAIVLMLGQADVKINQEQPRL